MAPVISCERADLTAEPTIAAAHEGTELAQGLCLHPHSFKMDGSGICNLGTAATTCKASPVIA